mgnify:CR=1 FL=1|tara:strand:- start:5418 stop:5603 length:186 start_codon:yes stop_codon:yes gene_type:complete
MQAVIESEVVSVRSCEIAATVNGIFAEVTAVVLEVVHGYDPPLCKEVWDVSEEEEFLRVKD